mmetsp:Transcript_44394/g.111158  ORF Transcript_44394/g.111158 Transcript_44394/m.111158 type:complete len:293 (-) Transcript_44394:48-926(-)
MRASLMAIHWGEEITPLMNSFLSSAASKPSLMPAMYSLSPKTSAATIARRGLPSTVSISSTLALTAFSLSMMLPNVTLKLRDLPARGWLPSSVTSSSVTSLMTAIWPVASCITMPGSILRPSGGVGIWSRGTTATLVSSYSPYASEGSHRTSRVSPILRPKTALSKPLTTLPDPTSNSRRGCPSFWSKTSPSSNVPLYVTPTTSPSCTVRSSSPASAIMRRAGAQARCLRVLRRGERAKERRRGAMGGAREVATESDEGMDGRWKAEVSCRRTRTLATVTTRLVCIFASSPV